MAGEVLLDEFDVIDGLMHKIANIPFTNELDEPVYAVNVERVNVDTLIVETTDGARFKIICEGELQNG